MAERFESNYTSVDNGAYGCFGGPDLNLLAQTITIGTNGPHRTFSPTSIKLILYRNSPSGQPGTVTVTLQSLDGNGNPSGTIIASGTTDGDTLEFTPGDWREITFTTVNDVLHNNDSYAIVVYCEGMSVIDEVNWRWTSLTLYGGGNIKASYDGGDTWEDVNPTTLDFIFDIWGTASDTILNGNALISILSHNTTEFYRPYSGTNTFSIGLSALTKLSYDYISDGNISISILPSSSKILNMSYNGISILTILPEGEYYEEIIYDGKTNLSLLPSYSSILEKIYSGSINITLLTNGEYSLIGVDFIYNGNIDMILLPSYQSILEGIYSGEISLIITPSAIYSLSNIGTHTYSGSISLELLPSYSSILDGIYSGLIPITILPNSEYALETIERTYSGLIDFILTLSSIRVAPASAKRYGKPEPAPYSNISIIRAMNEIRRGYRNEVVD